MNTHPKLLHALLPLLLPAVAASASAQTCLAEMVSTDHGVLANEESTKSLISRDGKWVLFTTFATNLVDDGGNNFWDVVLWEQATGDLTFAGKPFQGVSANNHVWGTSISGDGRWSCMESAATDLVPGDNNNRTDVFVFDRVSGMITLESLGGTNAQGNGNSFGGCVSDDGLSLVFASDASDLIAGDTNGVRDIFLRDRVFGTVTLVSVGLAGALGDGLSGWPTISGDCRYIAFASYATNLVPGDTTNNSNLFVRDMLTGTTAMVDVTSAGVMATYGSGSARISADGRCVAFLTQDNILVPGDTNNNWDLFVRDMVTGAITRENVDFAGNQISTPPYEPSLSADGRYVSFNSSATNHVLGDNNNAGDVFIRDRLLGVTRLASLTSAGTQLNDGSNSVGGALSGDGQAICFHSLATNVVPGDTNGRADVFARSCSYSVSFYCTPKLNSLGCLPAIGYNGISSASSPSGFEIQASLVRNNKSGLLLYSVTGPNSVPFQGGTLCLLPPLKRGPGTTSGGNSAPTQDCSGLYSLDMNAFAQGLLGGTPASQLSIAGTSVWCQWWGRDPGFTFPLNTTLSNALSYTVLP